MNNPVFNFKFQIPMFNFLLFKVVILDSVGSVIFGEYPVMSEKPMMIQLILLISRKKCEREKSLHFL